MTMQFLFTQSRFLSLLLSLLLALWPVVASVAQDPVTGAFVGSVTDSQTNTPISNATVQVLHQRTQVPIATRTNEQGHFYHGLLSPGEYVIKINADGYALLTLRQTVLATQVNTVIPLPVKLTRQIAAASAANPLATAAPGPNPLASNRTANTPSSQTSVPASEPTSLAAEINRTDGRRGGAFTESEVAALPLGAATLTRSFDEFALLLPGVALPPQTQGSVAGPGVGAGVGSAGQFAVNGLRSRGNNFTVDGSDNNDEDIGVRRQGFTALVPQPIESVQEYQVTTLLAPAQYGRNLGAQVNAVSKSGGKEMHGALYGFLNASSLNARNYFDTTAGNDSMALRAGHNQPVLLDGAPLQVRNGSGGQDSFTLGQGGFAVGGPMLRFGEGGAPVYRNVFYFLSAEQQVQNANQEASFAVPTVEKRGLFASGASGYFFRTQNNQLVRAYPTSRTGGAIFSLFPFPNHPGGLYDANTFTQTLPASARGTVVAVKLDGNFKLGDKRQSFTARYNATSDWREIPVTGEALFSGLRPHVRTQNFSAFLNSALAGNRFHQIRLSYGRTRLFFAEVRDPFLLPSRQSPHEPFLLNAREVANLTLSPATGGPNTGPVTYYSSLPNPANVVLGTVEDILGRVGQVRIGGYSPVGADVFNFPQRRVNNTYQLADTFTWRTRAAALIMGADLRRSDLNSALPRNARTLINFDGAPLLDAEGKVVAFLPPIDLAAAGAPSGAFLSLARNSAVSSAISLRFYQLNFFGQTEWRLHPKLSLSTGLRYEYNTVPHETHNSIEKTFNDPLLRDQSLSPFIGGLNHFIAGRTKIYEPDRNNCGPRVGLAFAPQLFGTSHTTVVRGGYGVFYDQIPGAVVSQSRNVFPNFITVNNGGFTQAPFIANPSIGRLSFINPAAAGFGTTPLIQSGTLNTLNPVLPLGLVFGVLGGALFPTPFGATLPARNLVIPKAQHYALVIEQALPARLLFSAAYIGTKGDHLLRFTTPNLGPNNPLLIFDGGVLNGEPFLWGQVIAPSSGKMIGRPVSGVGAVNLYETTARSRYDALQVQVRGRFRSSLQYQMAYTFSKAMDDVSDIFALAGAAALPQDSLKPDERGPANFDARHRWAYNFAYRLPTLPQRAAQLLFGDWEFSGTGQFQTGQPFTINSLIDINQDGNLTDRLNPTNILQVTDDRRQPVRRLVLTNPINPYPNFGENGRSGRNTFRAGSYLLLNLAVVKNFNFTEQQRLTLRAEVFNLTNRANFGVPVRFFEAPSFGAATTTVSPGRRVQFALKYSF